MTLDLFLTKKNLFPIKINNKEKINLIIPNLIKHLDEIFTKYLITNSSLYDLLKYSENSNDNKICDWRNIFLTMNSDQKKNILIEIINIRYSDNNLRYLKPRDILDIIIKEKVHNNVFMKLLEKSVIDSVV